MGTHIINVLLATLACALPAQSGELQDLSVEAISEAFYIVGSRYDDKALGGYGRSKENYPQPMTWANPGEDDALILTAVPQAIVPYMLTAEPRAAVPYMHRYRGMLLRLFNWTDEEAAFRAADSNMRIIQEALDSSGRWRPIERAPFTSCGNSHHNVFLPAGHYWELVVPRYTGSMRTRLRFVIHGSPELISNEFEGSINPGQFSEKVNTR